MTNLIRKSEGQPLRDAMKAKGISGPELAEATRRADPAGKGVSAAAIGFLTGTGKSSRSRCRLATAWWICEALDEPLHHHFSMSTPSTATVERSRSDDPEHH